MSKQYELECGLVVDEFRGVNKFESFEAFMSRNLTCEENDYALPQELTHIYCAMSGLPFAARFMTDIHSMIEVVAKEMTPADFNDVMFDVTPEDANQLFDSIIDHCRVRLITLSRPAPSIAVVNDRMSLAHLDSMHQAAILTNLLLWDAGMYRDGYKSVDDQFVRITNSIDTAKQLRDIDVNRLHALLIELDAKYNILKLDFSRKERKVIDEIRNGESVDFERLMKFIDQLLSQRDEHAEVDPSRRWTQQVYASQAFEAAERLEQSNLHEEMIKSNRPSNRHIKPKGTSRPKGTGTNRKPKNAERASLAAAFSASLKGLKL